MKPLFLFSIHQQEKMLGSRNLSLRNLLVTRTEENGKVCLHRPLATKRHLIHVCRLVRHLNSPLISNKKDKENQSERKSCNQAPKTQGRRSRQSTASCKRGRIENESTEVWYCFMCDDIVKKDLIKRQVCVRLAHRAFGGVCNGMDVFRKVVEMFC